MARCRLSVAELTHQAALLSAAEMSAFLDELGILPNFAETELVIRARPREHKAARNAEIRRRFSSGEATIGGLALDFGLSRPRIWRIIQQKSVNEVQR